ncbi:MAG: hypothetical protein ACLQUY_21770 [Ktedonobacterales bacterium]
MVDVPTTRQTLQEAHRWRDVLWESIVEDLERRDPPAADAVRETVAHLPVLMYRSRSTWYAARTWRYLDAQARQEWIWVCEFIHEMWIRRSLGNATAGDRVAT